MTELIFEAKDAGDWICLLFEVAVGSSVGGVKQVNLEGVQGDTEFKMENNLTVPTKKASMEDNDIRDYSHGYSITYFEDKASFKDHFGFFHPSVSDTQLQQDHVIKIVLQFCKDNSLHQTFQTLQSECQVSLNTVDSLETFVADINSGRWDAILPQVAQLKLPRKKLEDLYEQIVLEMIELRELDTARAILRQTQAMSVMKQEHPERYLRLEHLLV
ncbi:hypothetical protein L2E82_40700 [Cichorium intybus]|uniref:Uncharacterized protein n=1 Tax=Cichorium intybus TaxID=13427 RepID=A0ACB9AMP4_CICIN|nr:hypothetical protein L2E82_40700 [Cichorium intybus]